MNVTDAGKVRGVRDPVRVTLDCGLLYTNGERTYRAKNGYVANLEYAERVLRVFEEWSEHWWGGAAAITHIGIYNYRPIRGRKRKLSNHAFGMAMDWMGIHLGGKKYSPYELAENAPAKLNDLKRRLEASAGDRLEWLTYREKGQWLHVGLKPE